MKRKNVLHITVRADYGGGPNYINSMVNNMSDEFVNYIACPDDKPYYSIWKDSLRVKDIFLLPHRKFRIFHLFKLSSFVRRNKIVLLQANGKGAGVYGRLLKLLNPNLKVIYAYRGFHIYEYNSIQRRLYFLYEKLMSLLTDKIINVSKGEQRLCLKHKVFHISKSICIYNGIKPLVTKRNAILDKRYEKYFVIVTLSRFDYAKNMELMYLVAKSLIDEDRIKFVWIGDGEDKDKLAELAIKEKVTNIDFVGFKNKEEISEYFSLANLYISTSRWEGMPFALIEACSLNIPIVASNVTGNNEVCIDEVNGLLFESNNISSAIEKIKKLLNHKEVYNNYQSNSKEVFRKNFTLEEMVSKHEKLYNSLLK